MYFKYVFQITCNSITTTLSISQSNLVGQSIS